jgi:hypothetical protein
VRMKPCWWSSRNCVNLANLRVALAMVIWFIAYIMFEIECR